MFIDILQIITNYSIINSQINICCIDLCTNVDIFIYSLTCSRTTNITQKIIGQHKFSRLKRLDCSYNQNIINISHLSDSLEELYCDEEELYCDKEDSDDEEVYCVSEDPDNETDSDEIDSEDEEDYDDEIENEHISDMSYDQEPEKTPNLSGYICQEDISKLWKLKILSCKNNRKINNVNHLANILEELYCGGSCGIKQNGLSELKKLKVLDCCYNAYIIDVNIFKNTLQELYCAGPCGIGQQGIDKLEHLKKLVCMWNENITDIGSLHLEELYCEYSGIKDKKNIKKAKWYNRI